MKYEQLKQLERKAAPPKWEIEPHTSADKHFDIIGVGVIVDYDDVDHQEQDATARFIVELRNAAPALFGVIDAAKDAHDYWGVGNAKPEELARLMQELHQAIQRANL